MATYTYPLNEDRITSHLTIDLMDGDLNELGVQWKMPVPQGLSIGDNATYENADLGLKGLAVGGKAHGGDGTVEKLEEEEATQSQADQQSKDDPNKKGTAGKVVDDLISRFGGNLGRVAVGVSPNPNTRAVFRQVNLRSYQLSFTMIPASTDEAKEIRKLVERFRTELYPEAQGYGENDQFVTAFKFPNLFQTRVHLGGRVVREIKFLPAYLTNMTTTFNSSTNAIMAKNGGDFSFAETTINLTFMEYRALWKKPGSDKLDFKS